MEKQNQRHALWRPKRDNFNAKISSKWKQSVFIPKYPKNEDEKEDKFVKTEESK